MDVKCELAESLSSHQYKTFIVDLLHKLWTNTQVQLGRWLWCLDSAESSTARCVVVLPLLCQINCFKRTCGSSSSSVLRRFWFRLSCHMPSIYFGRAQFSTGCSLAYRKEPSFTQSASSFLSTCPYHLSLPLLIESPIASTSRSTLICLIS